mmetsp:Transcript_34457/g.77630  ORF Transcript_34457/g.77630 Transcript_34457/m.77630 type:complete len:182 (+) Transcript_34457:679-1224(+)
MYAFPSSSATIPIAARGSMAPQFAVAMAPGVSTRARTVPAMDARIVPRMVWGRVNLYRARRRAESEPDSTASRDLAIASGSKSPSTARREEDHRDDGPGDRLLTALVCVPILVITAQGADADGTDGVAMAPIVLRGAHIVLLLGGSDEKEWTERVEHAARRHTEDSIDLFAMVAMSLVVPP